MKRQFLSKWMAQVTLLLLCLATTSFYFFHSLENVKDLGSQENPSIKQQTMVAQAFNFPLYFEKNEGQVDENVKYLHKGKGYTFYFTPQSIVISLCKALEGKQLPLAVLNMQFLGAQQNPLIKGMEEQSYKTNYFIGSEPSKWHTNVPTFDKVCYEQLYPGIDAIFYGNKQQLEYDLCVAPGANPKQIHLQIEGIKKLSIDLAGNLHIHVEDDQEMLMQKPIVYQIKENEKIFIEGNFILLAQNEIGFALGAYDQTKELVIDPGLAYSTYLGGSNVDLATGIAIDSSGNAYVVGTTNSTNFPTTVGAFRSFYSGGLEDVFVTKINSAGSGLIFSTYLGGSNEDNGQGIAVDNVTQDVFVTGFTVSTNFPVTLGAFQTAYAGGTFDAFVTKIDSTGSALIYSSYLGGSQGDQGFGIAIDTSGNAYVTGDTNSPNFPTTAGVFQTAFHGTSGLQTNSFLTKFNAAGSSLLYSTYLGGSGGDGATGIALNSLTEAYIVGHTHSTDFPTTVGAFQTASGGGLQDGFVTRFNSAATALIYSTYLGGSLIDQVNAIAVNATDFAYVVGITSSNNFPTTAGAFQSSRVGGGVPSFITQINPAGSALVYSTYFGGTMSVGGPDTTIEAVALDSNGNAYITGSTNTTNFPTTVGAFQSTIPDGVGNNGSAFVTEFNSSATGLIYSTYFGGASGGQGGTGIAVDSSRSIYITGSTAAVDFPTTTGAFQTALAGSENAFIAKFEVAIANVTGISPNSGPTAGGTVVTITGTNFIGVTSVNFGGTPATSFIVNSPTQITAVSPPGSGTVNVTVSTADGTSPITPADEFTYINERIPTTTTLTIVPNPAGQPITFVANVAPSAATGTVTFFDGSTPIGTVPVVNGVASLTISLPVGSHFISAVYSGDANFLPSASSSSLLAIGSSCTAVTVVLPPTKLKGRQKVNEFATQTDIANILTWKPPTEGIPPAAYRIYRNQTLTELIGVVPAYDKLQFVDNNRKKGKTYTYWVVSVDSSGNVSTPTTVTVHSRS